MVHIKSIQILSMCAHHLAAIVGRAHFAYIPNDKVVGLSKIPRMVHVLMRRPQLQENLTQQIVDIFDNTIKPKGCAVQIKAYHFCMMYRGVQEPTSYTETTALRGALLLSDAARAEFLAAAKENGVVVFP